MIRTHDAGSLRAADAGATVTLAGWVARRRDHGGVIFVDLRDGSRRRPGGLPRGGRPRTCATSSASRSSARSPRRPAGNENPDLPTGEVEVDATALEVLSEAAPLPLPVDDNVDAGDDIRLRYRYLDLRRSGPAGALQLRSPGQPDRPRGAARPRLQRDRDADPDPVDAGGRPRLPGAGPPAARHLVRPAAVAAAVQAAADGRRHGALLPDRPLLPRRGLPRRPAAGVHPARHRDVVRHPGRRDRARRGDRRGAVGGAGRRHRRRGRSRGSPGTTRWPGTAPTSPTCATASS